MVPASQIGNYELRRPLGAGGYGEVWEATRTTPDGQVRHVALKVLHQGVDAMRREARLGSLLRHRNLVDVYELGESDGRGYCAMELCPHGSLADRPPLSLRALVEVGLAVCAALRYAQEELGLVHRDLKPDNLLVSAGGVVKVGDLGIAWTGKGQDVRASGTPGFMAPEQRSGTVDGRCDIFALGVTLRVLASGRPGDDRHTIEYLEGPDQTDVAGDVVLDPALAVLLDRCTEPHPDDRFQDLASLSEALRALPLSGPSLAEQLGLPVEVAQPLGVLPLVGRADDLRKLSEVVARAGTVALAGPPGIGKTRLAMEFAQRWSGDSVVCEVAAARSIGEVLASISAGLGLAPANADLPAVIAQVGGALAARGEALLVLDAVDETAAALLPVMDDWRVRAPALRVLATARAVPPWGEPFPVGLLSPEASQSLLCSAARERGVDPSREPRLPELVAGLEGLPLALRLMGGRLGVLTVGDLCDRTSLSMMRTAADDRRGPLAAALDASWEGLDQEQRDVLAQLSVFAGPFEADVAAAVVDRPAADLARTFDALLARSLLAAAESGRVRLLRSVREYARAQVAEVEAAEIRHGRWFGRPIVAGSAPRADLLYDILAGFDRAEARGDSTEVATLLLAAWDLLVERGPLATVDPLVTRAARCCTEGEPAASVAWVASCALLLEGKVAAAIEAAVRSRDLARSDRLRSRGYLSLARCLRVAGRNQEGVASAQAAVELAGTDLTLRLQSLSLLGTLLHRCGELVQARTTYSAALAEASSQPRQALGLLGNLAITLRELDEPDAGLDCASRGLAIARTLGERRLEALFLVEMGVLQHLRSSLVDAEASVRSALGMLREVGRVRELMTAQSQHASILMELGRDDEAEALLRESQAFHLQSGEPLSAGRAQAAWGTLHHRRGRTAEARTAWEAAAADLSRAGAATWERAEVHGNLALLELEQGRVAEAGQMLDDAIALVGGRRCSPLALLLMRRAKVASFQGASRDAERLLHEALQLLRHLGDRRGMTAVLHNLGVLAADTDQLPSALGYLEEALALRRTTGNPRGVAVSLLALGEVRADLGDRRGAAEALEEGVGLVEQLDVPHLAAVGNATLAWLGDAAPDHFARAEEVLRGRGDSWELARVLGLHAARTADPTERAALLGEARALGAGAGRRVWRAIDAAELASSSE